jgi:cytochrome b involved in lipid metabolism
MTNRITYLIIAGVIVFVLLLGGIFIFALMGRETADKKADDILGLNSKEIALSEVQKNNTASSCWTIVGGNVYDATSLIAKNKPIEQTLATACGADGTKVYTILKYEKQNLTNQQISELFNQLQTSRIGIIAP